MREYKPITDQDSLRHDLIKRVAEEHGLPYKTVERIVMFQFKDVLTVMSECNDVEITGLGTILVSKPRTMRRINYLKGMIKSIMCIIEGDKWSQLPAKKQQNYKTKLLDLETKIKYLEERLVIYESRH